MTRCQCDASWLTPGMARAGGLACQKCGGAWIQAGGQLTLTAGVAERLAAFLASGGEVVHIPRLADPVYIRPHQVVQAPGRARLEECPDCGGAGCEYCDRGWLVWRACPRCGDPGAWRWLNSDRERAGCGRCGMSWSVTDPGWLAQRVPGRLAAIR